MDHNAPLLTGCAALNRFPYLPNTQHTERQQNTQRRAAGDSEKEQDSRCCLHKHSDLMRQRWNIWLYKYINNINAVSSLCAAVAHPYLSPLPFPLIFQTLSCGSIKLIAAFNCKIISVKPRWVALLIPHSSMHTRSSWNFKPLLPKGDYFTCSPMLPSPPRSSQLLISSLFIFLSHNFCVLRSSKSCPRDLPFN